VDICQGAFDNLHVKRPLAHLHPELVDDAAILRFGMAVTRRQAASDDHTVAAHRDPQLIAGHAVHQVSVVGRAVVDREAVLFAKAFQQWSA
jgi:hypothetical protein